MTTDVITINQHKEMLICTKKIIFINFDSIHIHGLFIRLCKMAVRHQ